MSSDSKEEPLLPPSSSSSPPPPPPSSSPSPASPVFDPTDASLYTPHRWPLTSLPRHISYPLLSTYFFLAIAQSVPTTAISFLLIYSIDLSPALVNSTYTLWFQAGVTRPLWGLLSDQVPLWGYRRRPYLLGACVLCVLCTLGMGWEGTGSGATAFVLWGLGVYLFWAVAEAMTDSAVVELGNDQVHDAIRRLGLLEQSAVEQRERRREYGMETDDDRQASDGQPRLAVSTAPSSAFARYTSPVDIVTQRVKARLQSECMAVRTVGTIVAYAVSIGLLRVAERQWREVVVLNALSFVPAIVSACFIQERGVLTGFYGLAAVRTDGTVAPADTDSEEDVDEEMVEPSHSARPSPPQPQPRLAELATTKPVFFRAKLAQLWSSLRVAFLPLLFLFFYYAVPSSSDTYYYFLYGGDFAFEAWEADLFSFIALLGSLAGTLFYSRFLSSTPIARLFLITVLLTTAAESLRFLLVLRRTEAVGLSPAVFIPLSSLVSAFIGGIRNMLPIVLAHQHAPRVLGMEGSVFSLFQTADRVGVLVSGATAAALTDALGIVRGNFSALWVLMLVCMALDWLPLPLVPLMLRRKPPPDAEIALQPLQRKRRMSEDGDLPPAAP